METVGQLRKAVVFHLYYHELWEKIKPYLLNLQEIGAFDLYITTPVENKELFDSIKQSFSCAVNIYIYIVKNEGADLYPFFEVLDSLDLDQYDILYKIHTKRDVKQRRKINGINCGLHYWRECMLNDILGKTTVRNRLQDFIDDEKLGASGYFPYLISIPHSPDKYYGGTIFMARAHLYKCLQHKYAVHDFVNTSGNRFSDFTYQCEALLGCCIAEQGYSYRKGSMLRNFILKLLSHRVTYPLYEFYVNKCILKT